MARSKEFHIGVALDRAMETFWLQGYAGTSLQDLLRRMRIGRQSLYDTFGNKRELYLRVLDRYAELPVGRALARLEAPGATPEDVTTFFRRLVVSQSGPAAAGCLMVGAAQELARTDAAVAERVARHRRRLEAAFRNALDGHASGERLVRAAVHLATLTEGLLLAGRSSASVGTLEAIAGLAEGVVKGAMRKGR